MELQEGHTCDIATSSHADAIFEKIREAGFEIAYEKEMMLTKEQAEEFYKEHQGKDFYDSLTTNMSRYY